jgi:hypothetical protein
VANPAFIAFALASANDLGSELNICVEPIEVPRETEVSLVEFKVSAETSKSC